MQTRCPPDVERLLLLRCCVNRSWVCVLLDASVVEAEMTESPLSPLGSDRSGLRSAGSERWGSFDNGGAEPAPEPPSMGTVTVTVQLGFRVSAEQEREILPAIMRAALALVDTSGVELLHANTARNEILPVTKRNGH